MNLKHELIVFRNELYAGSGNYRQHLDKIISTLPDSEEQLISALSQGVDLKKIEDHPLFSFFDDRDPYGPFSIPPTGHIIGAGSPISARSILSSLEIQTSLALPEQYRWVMEEKNNPKMITEALSLYGTLERPGAPSNGTIMNWAHAIGGSIEEIYTNDAIPWCGLFMAYVALRAGKKIPGNALRALAWAGFGRPVPRPMYGDTVAFSRTGGGHVAIYIGEDDEAYHILGGNQSDRVCFTRIPRYRLYAACRPEYNIGQPSSVRVVPLAANGELSKTEQLAA